jgi:DNA-binding transcriptional MerR regulator
MRMSQLSTLSGVPVATVKYYLREGLLFPGAPTAVNQADYGETHVRRLSLIRALIDVGGLSVATARDVLDAVDTPDAPLAAVFERAQVSVSQTDLYTRAGSDAARAWVDELVRSNGWNVSETNPGRTAAANVIDAFVGINHPELVDLLHGYAAAALAVAQADLDAVARQPDVSAMAETVVAGTVLGDAMFAALRRIAQEHVTSERFPVPEGTSPHLTAAPISPPEKRNRP